MKVLVIGSGGREHALAWCCAQDAEVQEVLVAPGNAGTARETNMRNVSVAADDLDGLLKLARDEAVELTMVGPEQPLVAGIVDRFQEAGLRCFGPSAAAAQLEGSKAFSKAFMQRHGIPTAAYGVFEALPEALDFVEELGAPLVVKADGLAAGKGVIVAEDLATARAAVTDMLDGNRFGAAGHRVVIEEFLAGEEASFIAICDGHSALPLATSQDHKAAFDGDTGPNTGGMGAYSPAPLIDEDLHREVLAQVIQPTLDGMAAEGHPFVGFLYAGLMIGEDRVPRVLEFNVRFGDPETQPVLLRLRSSLPGLCQAALDGRIDQAGPVSWDPRPCLGVVLAAEGYPGAYDKGKVISGLDQITGEAKVFHAGTREGDGQVLTAGGRVLCVCALADSVAAAQAAAYENVEKIHWDGLHYRTDIGHRAIGRQ
ncbi:MAG: phosphoribosylamine--glycine ligase [Pseudomonadota bacterium]